VEILCTFLDSFVKEGVPCNETDLIMVYVQCPQQVQIS